MAKPIFIAVLSGSYMPHQTVLIGRMFEKLKDEYHVFFFPGEKTEFKMFIPSEVQPISIDDIKSFIMEKLK